MQHNAVFSAAPRTTPALAYAEGNYRDYEADFKRRNPELAENPHRIKYKALVRCQRSREIPYIAIV